MNKPSKITAEQLMTYLNCETLPGDEVWLCGADYGDAQLWIVRDGNIVNVILEG